jgi:hypothetical protein
MRVLLDEHLPRRVFTAIRGRAGETAKALKQASGLSWPRFADFLEAWDLEAFSHPSLERSEAELFEALSGFGGLGGMTRPLG